MISGVMKLRGGFIIVLLSGDWVYPLVAVLFAVQLDGDKRFNY